LLLALSSAVILGSESLEADDHILLSQIRDSPNLKGQVRVFISPRNREFLRNNISELSSYLTGNILRLRWKGQPVLFRETVPIYWKNNTKHTDTLFGYSTELHYVKI
jgi:hypothetical protein